MRRVVSHLLGQLDAAVTLLVMLYDVRQAVELVKDRHHVRGPVRRPVYSYRVRLAEYIVGPVIGDLDVTSRVCGSRCRRISHPSTDTGPRAIVRT